MAVDKQLENIQVTEEAMDNKFTLCACMGPMYGEPHCICKMKTLGLKLNEEARAAENARAKEQNSNWLLHSSNNQPTPTDSASTAS